MPQRTWPLPVGGVVSRAIGDEFVLLHPETNVASSLDGISAGVWRAVNGGPDLDLADDLIDAAIADLTGQGYLQSSGGVSRRSLIRGGTVIAATGIATMMLPEMAAFASGRTPVTYDMASELKAGPTNYTFQYEKNSGTNTGITNATKRFTTPTINYASASSQTQPWIGFLDSGTQLAGTPLRVNCAGNQSIGGVFTVPFTNPSATFTYSIKCVSGAGTLYISQTNNTNSPLVTQAVSLNQAIGPNTSSPLSLTALTNLYIFVVAGSSTTNEFDLTFSVSD